MIWKYTLFGLVTGIIIGAVVMYFTNKKLQKQQIFWYQFKKIKSELDIYHQKLTNHFTYSVKLLDNMIEDYNQFCRYMVKNFDDFLQKKRNEDNPFRYRYSEIKDCNQQSYVEKQPKDYPECAKNSLDRKLK